MFDGRRKERRLWGGLFVIAASAGPTPAAPGASALSATATAAALLATWHHALRGGSDGASGGRRGRGKKKGKRARGECARSDSRYRALYDVRAGCRIPASESDTGFHFLGWMWRPSQLDIIDSLKRNIRFEFVLEVRERTAGSIILCTKLDMDSSFPDPTGRRTDSFLFRASLSISHLISLLHALFCSRTYTLQSDLSIH